MKLTLPLLFLLAGSLSGCILDPVSLVADPIMMAAQAAGPSDEQLQADFQASIRQALIDDDRSKTCAELTRLWPEIKALHQKDVENGQRYIETREQVIAEKGCVVPAPLAETTAQARPDVPAAVSAPTPLKSAPVAPSMPPAPASSPALSTSVATFTANETPERYRPRSCDYLHARLIETGPGLTSPDPEIQAWSRKAKSVVSGVLVENKCGPASWVGGRVGAVISTIDPIKAARLKLPLAGVWIEATMPGGSFANAGVLRGDTIVAVNDIPVADAAEFFVIVLKQPVGSTIRVKFWRVSTFMELPVVIAAPPVG